jgi:ligand-binding sensor domain-containing protein/signal transduction histidine kinase
MARAQTAEDINTRYTLRVWRTDDGLPQNSVYGITQTRDGYLWLTTFDGLVRYDGVQFTVFEKSNSREIISNRFISLYADEQGALWAGTGDGGLLRYRDGVFTSFTVRDGLPHNKIYDIQSDNRGGLLITTQTGYAYWRDGRIVPDPDKLDPATTRIHFSRSGAQWILDQSGLRRIKGSQTTRYPLMIEPSRLYITILYEDRRGNLWVGADSALIYRVNDEATTMYATKDGLPPGKNIEAIREDSQGNIWFCTTGSGLIRFSDDRFSVYNRASGLPHDDARMIFEDREGTLWAGMDGGGLVRLSQRFMTTYSTQNGLYGDNVYPIYQDRAGAIWIGSNGGLARYSDGRLTTYTEKDALRYFFHAQALAEDREGRLWIGSYNELGYFQNEQYIVSDLVKNNSVWAVYEDKSGALWIGTALGLIRYKDGQRTLYTTREGLPDDDVKAIHEDRQGSLWFATSGGLARWNNGRFENLTEREGLSSNHVRCIYEDAAGTFWIGTYDGGMNRLKDGRITAITARHGLWNNGVFQILEDHRGFFWIGCNKGIYRVSREQLEDFAEGRVSSIICMAFGKADGMLNTECNGGRQPAGIKARDNKLWFPTQGGVVVIDPTKAPLNSAPPPVRIEAVRLDRQAMDFQNEVRVASDQKYLEISFTGLSLIKSEQVRFKYKLEGQDANWTDAGAQRVAYYSYLPPGRYTFTVIAANTDGVWNHEGASIRIRVLPPFWRTWWFLSLVTLALAGLILLVHRQRVAMLRKAHEIQLGFSRQLIDSQESERKRIAAELHDSLGQSLVVIKNRAVMSLKQLENGNGVADQLKVISTSSSQAIQELKEISYNLRPYLLDRLGLSLALKSMLHKAFDSGQVSLTTEIDSVDGVLARESEIHVFRIVQESVNNIIKHAQATEAKVIVRKSESSLTLTIADNGVGFVTVTTPSGELARRSYGLIGISERVRLLGGWYTIDSAPGEGATLIIHLPLKDGRNGE